MGEQGIEIGIPADNDGFVLMQCPLCGDLFKLRPQDVNDDDVLEIHCPLCGIVSESYFTQDVIEFALKKAANWGLDALYDELKSLERETKGKPVSIKTGRRPDHEHVSPLMPRIEALAGAVCETCGRPAKVSPLLLMSEYVCPCCGEVIFNDR